MGKRSWYNYCPIASGGLIPAWGFRRDKISGGRARHFSSSVGNRRKDRNSMAL